MNEPGTSVGLSGGTVSAFRTASSYGETAPYSPPRRYPEYPFRDGATDPSNGAYDAVREAFVLLGLDRERFGTAAWNPLGEVIDPGMSVTLVPNLLTGNNFKSGALIVHPSIVRAVMDYVCIALKGRGTIAILVTSPGGESAEMLMEATGLPLVVSYVQGQTSAKVQIVDPRHRVLRWIRCGRVPLWSYWAEQSGDEAGDVSYCMGTGSFFRGMEDRMDLMVGGLKRETRQDFRSGYVRYEVPRAVVDADVLISLPKLKTHMKSGITICAKGWVGLMSNRSGLPHYRQGSPASGGDQYPNEHPARFSSYADLRRMCMGSLLGQNLFGLLSRFTNRLDKLAAGQLLGTSELLDGGWFGNDTIWRAVLDLHRIAVFGDRHGGIADRPQRKIVCLVDGIIAGEGEGPYSPIPVAAGMLLAGVDPLAVDCVATRLMGYDPALIPTLARGFPAFLGVAATKAEFQCLSNVPEWSGAGKPGFHPPFSFRPPKGWVGHIEARPGGSCPDTVGGLICRGSASDSTSECENGKAVGNPEDRSQAVITVTGEGPSEQGFIRRGDTLHFAATVISPIIALFASLVAAKFLLPAELGAIQTVMLFAGYLAYLDLGVTMGLFRNIPVYAGRGQTARAQSMVDASWMVVKLVAGVGIVVAVGVMIWAFAVRRDPLMGWASLGLAAYLVAAPFDTFFTILFRGMQQFHVLGRRLHWKNVLQTVTTIFPALWGPGGLIAKNILLPIAGVFLLRPGLPFTLGREGRWADARQLSKVGLPILGVNLLTSFLGVADRSVIAMFQGTEAVGHYALATLILAGLPVLPAALGAILYPRAAHDFGRAGSSRALRKFFWVSFIFNLGVMIPASFLCYLLIGPLTRRFLPEYEGGIAAAEITALGSVFLLYVGQSNILVVVRRNFLFGVFLAISIAIVWLAGGWLSRIGWGIEGVALARVIANAFLCISVVLYAGYCVHRDIRCED